MRSKPSAALLLLIALGSSSARPGSEARAEPPPQPAVELPGIARGLLLRLEPLFRFKATEEAFFGVLGTLTGTTREFESVEVEFGADRSVFAAAQRSAYEAYRIRHVVQPGQLQATDLKPDVSVVRMKNPFNDAVYVAAVKQVGRTVVFARGEGKRADEAGLVKLVKSTVAGVTSVGDDIDGWIPQEVKATWTHTPAGDFILVEDGTVDAARRDEALKAVRAGHGTAKRLLASSWNAPFAPVVRVTAKRDLLSHLARRRDLREADAVYVPFAGELLVSPRGPTPDAGRIAAEAAAQAVHYVLGGADAEPVLTGIMRQAAAQATGVPVGGLLPEDEEQAFARVKGKKAVTWYHLLRLPTLKNFLKAEPTERAIDAELAVAYLGSSASAAGKIGLTAWVAGFRKVGDSDAASEAAVAAMDPGKSNSEYWAYWGPRADPPKKPGDKSGAPATKPGAKPATK